MKKRLKKEVIPVCLSWTYGIEITKLEDDIVNLKKLGCTHIDIESFDSCGGSSIEITALKERLETDQEYKTRIKKESHDNEIRVAREKDEFKRLKEKYG